MAIVDNAIEHCDPDDQDVELLAWSLLLQGGAFLHRYFVLNDPADLDHSVYLLEVSLCISDPSESAAIFRISSKLLAALTTRHNRTGAPVDLDHIIEIEERLILHPECEDRKDVLCKNLSVHLNRRLSVHLTIGDATRIVRLCKDMLPLTTSENRRSWWSGVGAGAVGIASDLGGKVVNWQQAIHWLELEEPDRVGAFLVVQLKVAVTKDDQEMAIGLEREIHARSRSSLFPPLSFSTDSDAALDDAIESFKNRRFSFPPDVHLVRYQATALVLVLALYARYDRSHRIQDLRDALHFRMSSRLGPLGTFCFDLLLLESSKTDLDPVGASQRLAEAKKLHDTAARAREVSFDEFHCPGCGARYSLLNRLDFGVKNAQVLRLKPGMASRYPLYSILPMLSSTQLDTGGPDAGVVVGPRRSTGTGSLESHRTELLRIIIRHIGQAQHGAGHREKATEYLEELRDTLKDGDQSFDARYWRKNWGDALFQLEDRALDDSESMPISLQYLALDYLREFATDQIYAPHQERLIALNFWFKHLSKAQPEGKEKGHVLEMAELTISLLQEQSEAAANTRASLDARLWTQGLLLEVVVETILSGYENLSRAVELLDWGQSIMWTQMGGERVAAHGNGAPDDPQRSSSTLESDMGSPHPIDTNHPRPSAEQSSSLFQELLKPKSWKEFERLGFRGPVVVLIPGRLLSIAVFFFPGGHGCLPLTISVSDLKQLHEALRPSVQTRAGNDHAGQEVLGSEDVSICNSNSSTSEASESKDERLRSLKRDPDHGINTILKVLWKEVAEPVFGELLSHVPIPGIETGSKGRTATFVNPVCRRNLLLTHDPPCSQLARIRQLDLVCGGAA